MAEQTIPPPDNRFPAAWLTLREGYDAIARSADLAKAFCEAAAGPAPRLIDLATGQGANAMYLRPLLPPTATWLLVDYDAELLAHAALRLPTGQAEQRRIDLATELHSIDVAACDGVTASALLDLVSVDWLERFAAHCAAAAVPVLLPLIYDGIMTWTPPDESDPAILSAFNRHQRSDKGFGPALGHAAAARAARVFTADGFTVDVRPSPWRLSADDHDMLDALIEGVSEACLEAMPAHRAETESWRSTRQLHRREGTLELLVGHVDVLALPPNF